MSDQIHRPSLIIIAAVMFLSMPLQTGMQAGRASAADPATAILDATGVKGGLVVHVGCGDGELTAALLAGDGYMVHGLDEESGNIERAREHIRSLGLYGQVSVDRFGGKSLPYIDNMVNLLVSEDLGHVAMDEVMRVLVPNGVAYVKKDGQWTKIEKPRPSEIDEWTHYLHDPSNNAVAHDTVVGPPRRMQWVGSPRWSRHHDRMSSVSAVVSASGRVFYIFDEASPASVLTQPEWTLIARDAFNGVVLWKRRISKWHTHLWPLKSGPAQLPRRLVASGNRVYVTLGLDAPLVALDAATGETVRTYKETKAAEEAVFSDGVLFALVNDATDKPDYDGRGRFRKGYGVTYWDEAPRKIVAVRADTGDVLWTIHERVLPGTLAVDSERVVFHNGESVVCLNRNAGDEKWRSEPIARAGEIRGFYVPILVLYEDVVLFSGGETAGKQTGSWYESGEDTLTALDARTGEVLWTAYHPPSGYRSPEDLLVVDGLVWTGETTSGRAVGVFTGRDPRTGEIKRRFPPDVDTYWFHHRCYRGKATDNYLLMSRTGTEFIDVRQKSWIPHHWVRGACLYGVMPANGLIYAPQHPCACYLEAKMYGFNALAPKRKGEGGRRTAEGGRRKGKGSKPRDGAELRARSQESRAGERLERGPAYGDINSPPSALRPPPSAFDSPPSALRLPPSEDWPTYRHDAARSGCASTSVSPVLKPAWQAAVGGKLTSPVVAEGKVLVASVNTHTVHALDASSGMELWSHTVGGRVDSPPTIHHGLALFGSADGHVYALRASDGELVWRFRAAPIDQRLMSFEQLESVWPVHGSVLVEGGELYCVAGRSMFLDGGLRLLRLDPKTGRLLSETVLDDRPSAEDEELQAYVSWLNMPTALPDILSSDGRLVYMRSQPFNLDGTRLPLEAMPSAPDADRGAPPATQRTEHAHLFCPSGFLDDSWWHRTYWLYGTTFVSGWCGYFRAGKNAPAGRILALDDSRVFGFGRKPQYYRWTTPIEHHLFATDKGLPRVEPEAAEKAQAHHVKYHWSREIPLLVRAMVLAEDTLLVAGPPDEVNEDEAFKSYDTPATQRQLAGQKAALAGRKGALLWAVSTSDGSKRAEYQLDSPPVFDGMIAAGQRLYLATTDGNVLCFSGNE
jgi:outer membrane protein assembly factor BamB